MLGSKSEDNKVKYDGSDIDSGYISEKIIAGTGISVAEGTGGDVNKLVITNSAPASTALTSANIFVGNGANVATGVALSGDASLSNAGVLGVNKTRLNVRNETGSTIVSTRAVYVAGFNNVPLISLADNTDEAKHGTIGVTIAPINHEANGFIATNGQFDAETNAWNVGDILYLSTAGALTSTMPTSGSVKIVGIVTVKEAYPIGKILLAQRLEENILAGGANTDAIIRLGDALGVNKASFRDYANNEVASVNSDGTINSAPLTASEILITDASKNIVSAPVATYPSLEELSYVKGLTSPAQTQLGNKQASLTFGIADTNALKVDSADVADNEYARFTANGLEGRTYAEVLADLGGSISGGGGGGEILLDFSSADSATAEDNVEKDLYSYTVPADTLSTNGDRILIRCLIYASEATGSMFKVYFAGSAIYSKALISDGDNVALDIEILKTSDTSIKYTSFYSRTGSTSAETTIGDLTEIDLTSNNIVKLTGLSVTAGDSVGKLWRVSKFGPIDGGTLTGELNLGENAGMALDVLLSDDGKYSGIVEGGTAGATLAFGDLCYLDPTDGRWELADANVSTSADGDCRGVLGICVLAAAADGDATKMLLWGKVRAATFPAFTINEKLFVSETAGDITHTSPTTEDAVVRVVGVAFTAEDMMFNPSPNHLIYTA